jgi:hypothetical protein
MGIGIIAMCLATLRPLLRTFTQALSSIRSSESSRNSSERSGRPSEPKEPISPGGQLNTKDIHPNAARRLPFLDITGTDTNFTTDETTLDYSEHHSSDTAVTHLEAGPKIKKATWWRPLSFNAGLMTEFNNAVKKVQDESSGSGSQSKSEKSDVEMGGFNVPKMRTPQDDL